MIVRSAAIFLCVAFLIGWGLPAGFVWLVPDVQNALSGFSIVFLASLFGPAVGGILAAVSCGREARRRYIGFLSRFAIGWRWYAGTAAVATVSFAVVLVHTYFAGGGRLYGYWSFWLLLVFLPPPIGDGGSLEELGFRGWLLPLLQGSLPPYAAALVVGLFWYLYHYSVLLPGFPFVEPGLSDFGHAALFFVQIMSLSFIFTVLFNASGGSVPLVFLAHWLSNAAIRLTPLSGETAVWPLVFLTVAIVVCFAGRRYLTDECKVEAL